MEYRLLGRTKINVSVVGMGCEGFARKSYQECIQMVDSAMELGINFWDMYSSEPELRDHVGKALARYARERYVIQGHLCSAWKDDQYIRTRDITLVRQSFEDLMERLIVDYIDVGMIHYVDDLRDYHEIMEGPIFGYAKELKDAGKIRCIGMSTHNQRVAMTAAESGAIDVIMMSINPAYDMLPPNEDINVLFDHTSFDRVYEGVDPERMALYQKCQAEGVALTVMKPFAGGLLFNPASTPFGKPMSPVQCISYCLDRPAVVSVLGGMANEDQIKQAAHYIEASAEEKDYGTILSNAPKKTFHGHCMYCGHCAPCSAKIDIALVNKYLDLTEAQGYVPETVQNHYDLLAHHAGECIACGNCIKNCPFGVDIIYKMKTAAEVFNR